MKRTTNDDGSTSYTLTSTEKNFLLVAVAYLFGRRTGYYTGRRSMAREIETSRPLQP